MSARVIRTKRLGRTRTDLLGVLLALSITAFCANQYPSKPTAAAPIGDQIEKKPAARAERRVTVDGVAVGDTRESVLKQWGTCEASAYTSSTVLVPKMQPPDMFPPTLGRRFARAEDNSCMTTVEGRQLKVQDGPSLSVGDSVQKVRDVFGEPEQGIYLYRSGCGGPGPATLWKYRRHGVILCFEVPNEAYWREQFEQSPPQMKKPCTFEEFQKKNSFLSQIWGVSVHLKSLDE